MEPGFLLFLVLPSMIESATSGGHGFCISSSGFLPPHTAANDVVGGDGCGDKASRECSGGVSGYSWIISVLDIGVIAVVMVVVVCCGPFEFGVVM